MTTITTPAGKHWADLFGLSPSLRAKKQSTTKERSVSNGAPKDQ